jgi:hypothetical protein
VLPCEVRVISATHPLFGQVLKAVSFKRWAGQLLLVVTLPDGSPGTVRADDTGVFGEVGPVPSAGVVLDAAGLRELLRLVMVIGGSACAAGLIGEAVSRFSGRAPGRRFGSFAAACCRRIGEAVRQIRTHVGSPHS